MNPIVEEMMAIYNGEELSHYGIKRRSGRYPWGSGEDPYQRDNRDFLSRVEELKKNGFKETAEEVKKEFGINLTEYRMEKSYANYQRRVLQVERAKSLQDDGKGPTEIGRIMGVGESTVRSWLNPDSEYRMKRAVNTAEFLKKQVDEKGMIDVGAQVEKEIGVPKGKLQEALFILEKEGYPTYGGGVKQINNPQGQQTNLKVLCPPGTEHKEIYELDRIKTITEYHSRDNGLTYNTFQYPKSMDSKRLEICYAEDGGINKDGIVELRRGVKDLSLGNDRYSQVRILVDGTHYIKGMAVYADDLPKGVDVRFNTNKTKDVAKMDVLKEIKKDPDNPFGSLIKPGGQSTYIDKDGKEQLSLINKRASEGDWTDWKDALPSQFLAKQSLNLAKKQLHLAKVDKLAEYDEICSINNPTIKKHLLAKFADDCDASATHLKAAALPGQKYHVIIPVNTLKDNEIYAPNYADGTKLALVRYPHGGTFEIPILKVNNKHKPAKDLIGSDSVDAVGINKKIADILSGADFDGDTVMCIPTHDRQGKVRIMNQDPLEGLAGFDPREQYGPEETRKDSSGKKHYYYKGAEYRIMSNTDIQMGVISNLITDMTLAGAGPDKLARAVRHSMVVIDAEKHKLDYKRSAIENDIASLHKEYQGKATGGASTILSRSKGKVDVLKRQGNARYNIKGKEWYDPSRPEGALIYKTADDLYYPDRVTDKKNGTVTISTVDGKKITYSMGDKKATDLYHPVQKEDPRTGEVYFTNKDGTIRYKTKTKKQKSRRMLETDDAETLVSDKRHPMELAYADYANSMKALANRARKEEMNTGKIEKSKAAEEAYKNEVASLMQKLNDAQLNSIRERAALRMATVELKAKQEANPDMDKDEITKAGQQAITRSRNAVGSVTRKERNIDITDREWEAIQAGAIAETNLKKILNNTDIDKLRERATPKATVTLTPAKINKIMAMSASNHSLSDIAKACGVSTATVSKYLKGVRNND